MLALLTFDQPTTVFIPYKPTKYGHYILNGVFNVPYTPDSGPSHNVEINNNNRPRPKGIW